MNKKKTEKVTLSELTVILLKYLSLYPQNDFSEQIFKTWHDLFRGEQWQVFAEGLRRAIKNPGQRFFPAPGEVQAHINDIKKENDRKVYKLPEPEERELTQVEKDRNKKLVSDLLKKKLGRR